MKLGIHLSIEHSIIQLPILCKTYKLDCFQFFTKSPRRWSQKLIDDETANAFKQNMSLYNINPENAFIHCSYLINPANPTSQTYNELETEFENAYKLGVYNLVLHPGSCKGPDCLQKVAQTIKPILSQFSDITLLLENTTRIGKNLYSDISGVEPVIKEFATNRDEAYFVSNQIKNILKQNDNSSVAVLYRNNNLSKLFEEYFMQFGIAYKKIGAHKFFDKKEIKDILSFIKIAYNEKDDVSFIRSIGNFGGIGLKTIDDIKKIAIDLNTNLFIAASTLTQKKYAKVARFIEFVKILQKKLQFGNISECLKFVFDEVFSDKNFYRQDVRQSNIDELIEFAKNMDIESFMENASLYDYSQSIDGENNLFLQNVSLMTIHAAKGLEFDHVFIVGLNEGILPSLYQDSVIEEERRIMYVGITRAKKTLYLSYYLSDFRNNFIPSRFLKEIAINKIQFKRYKIGETINHKDFGKGIILNVKEKPLELKVNFFKYGLKILTENDIF
ncbi:3'-5' exonuclease [Desulfurella sp.]|uniref:3'-5' exonuclease n=1 Tax=Desulfurella sp. TaxID=1962857 RepID=UPI0025C5020F|nr:3'-5' exonuclease [Desulfurella sp.]